MFLTINILFQNGIHNYFNKLNLTIYRGMVSAINSEIIY